MCIKMCLGSKKVEKHWTNRGTKEQKGTRSDREWGTVQQQ